MRLRLSEVKSQIADVGERIGRLLGRELRVSVDEYRALRTLPLNQGRSYGVPLDAVSSEFLAIYRSLARRGAIKVYEGASWLHIDMTDAGEGALRSKANREAFETAMHSASRRTDN